MLLDKQVSSIVLFVLLVLAPYNILGQKDCECIFDDVQEKVLLINERDSLEVFKFTNNLKSVNNPACIFKGLELECMFYLTQMKLKKSFEIINELEDFLITTKCKNQFTFRIYLAKAKYYKVANNFEKLSEFAFKSLKEAERLKDSGKKIESIREIVYLFTRMDEDYKNWDYIKRAQELIFNQENSIQSIKNYRWLAFEYEKKYTTTGRKSLLDSVLIFSMKSKMGAQHNNMYAELAMSYRALEAYSYHKGIPENALKYIDSAIFYGKKIEGVKNLSSLYLSKAWDHLDLGENENAIKWMDTALSKASPKDYVGNMMEYFDAADLYEQAGRLDKAYASFKTYTKMKDSIMNTERTEVINELETKYQTELKDAKIKRLTTLLIVSLLSLLSLLFIGALLRLRQSRKQNKALRIAFDKRIQLEKELSLVRDEIAQDFHDDLGNKLARISLLSNLISGEISINDPKVKSKIKQITEDANGLYRGTRDFVFSLKSNSNYIEEVATYLSDFGDDFFNKTTIKFTVDKEISSNDKLPHFWNKQLIFIFKEALTNTLKHSKCNNVMLSFVYKNSELIIICEDNGIGISKEEMTSSNGLLNMKKRALKIGGELNVDSKTSNGTIIIFKGKTS